MASAVALASDADRAEVLSLAVGLAHRLGDRATVGRLAPEALAGLSARPELAAVVRSWAEGADAVLDGVAPGTLPADVWMIGTRDQ